ncbi:MAG: ABC transporter permease [Opitutae bacterium]|jgi:lipopolysaccharide transport system permease protein|nr:ABC transporter permease [Opitutae bacterium]
MDSLTPSKQVTILKPNRSLFDLELQGFFHYRDLLFLLVRRDFVAKFKQTVLGPLWLVLQPLLGSVVFTLIFGVVAGMPTDGLPTFLFYLCGQLGWNYFAHTYGSSSGILQQNASIFGKVYFPRLIPPISVCISNLITYVVQVFVFAGFWIYFQSVDGYHFHITPWLAFLPLLLLQKALLAMGLGFLMSSLTVKYRDFGHIGGFIMQFMMYCTPIIYPLSLLLDKIPKTFEWVIHLNPLVYIIEMYRLMFLGTGTIPALLPFTSWAITLLLFLAGLMVFNKVQRTYVDYL